MKTVERRPREQRWSVWTRPVSETKKPVAVVVGRLKRSPNVKERSQLCIVVLQVTKRIRKCHIDVGRLATERNQICVRNQHGSVTTQILVNLVETGPVYAVNQSDRAKTPLVSDIFRRLSL